MKHLSIQLFSERVVVVQIFPEMCSLGKDTLAVIVKYLEEENFKETARTLERQSGAFFNTRYLEETVLKGEWDEAEKYLSGFTSVEENKYSTKMFFELRKQKYLEALDRRDIEKAVDILVNDLKVFSRHSDDLFMEMVLLITLDDFRNHKSLERYKDTQTARASISKEILKSVPPNPALKGKLQFPDVDTAALRNLIHGGS